MHVSLNWVEHGPVQRSQSERSQILLDSWTLDLDVSWAEDLSLGLQIAHTTSYFYTVGPKVELKLSCRAPRFLCSGTDPIGSWQSSHGDHKALPRDPLRPLQPLFDGMRGRVCEGIGSSGLC